MSKRELSRYSVKRKKRVVTTIVVEREVVTAGPVAEGVGRVVRRLRDQMGATQGELAERVGLSRTSITNIEIGRQRILFEDVWKLAIALNVTADGLWKAIYREIGVSP